MWDFFTLNLIKTGDPTPPPPFNIFFLFFLALNFILQRFLFLNVSFQKSERRQTTRGAFKKDNNKKKTNSHKLPLKRFFMQQPELKSAWIHVWSPRRRRQSALQQLPPFTVWFYAFDPRRTLRFAFLAFRPQSLLGYLLSPPAPSTIISQRESTAAARPTGARTWDTFDSDSWKSWKYPDYFLFSYRRVRERGFYDERVTR